jgi:hypothetical protein
MLQLPAVHVVFFPQSRVAVSSSVARALKRLGSLEGLPCIAFAPDATAEARALLAASGIQLLTLRDFGWTDERYNRVRMGTPH